MVLNFGPPVSVDSRRQERFVGFVLGPGTSLTVNGGLAKEPV